MKIKVILLIAAILLILSLSIFGVKIKEKAVKSLSSDLSTYNCDGAVCTTCFVDGNACDCGENTCICGNKTVKKEECTIVK